MGLKTLTEQGVPFEIRIFQQRLRHCLPFRDSLIRIYNDPIIVKAQWCEPKLSNLPFMHPLGCYKFLPDEFWKEIRVTNIIAKLIIQKRTDIGKDRATRDWDTDSVTTFNDFYGWIYEMKITLPAPQTDHRCIENVMSLKFETYRYHCRSMDFLKNRDILPNMLHSLIQQLIYQDPALYMLIMALRLDHAHRLIAIPYHTQVSRPGDNIAYRHLNVNLDRLVKHSQGNNVIQCAISFENERTPDCTHIVKGIHH
jgi:hypothetical protein